MLPCLVERGKDVHARGAQNITEEPVRHQASAVMSQCLITGNYSHWIGLVENFASKLFFNRTLGFWQNFCMHTVSALCSKCCYCIEKLKHGISKRYRGCLRRVVVWVPSAPVLLYELGCLAGTHLPWFTIASNSIMNHLLPPPREGRKWCIMGAVVQPESLPHRGEWEQKTPNYYFYEAQGTSLNKNISIFS